VNLVTLRGTIGDREVHVAGTLFGKRAVPRIVGINDHSVDMPPSSHMLVVRNSDTPGMIGRVAMTLGDAGINIADMDVGTNASGEAALMVLSTDAPVPAEVVERLRAIDGVFDALAIDLD
jgi:D-3-phosphoglycerate dehydrogenase